MFKKVFNQPSRVASVSVPHWKKGESTQNLGDFLSEYVHSKYLGDPRKSATDTIYLVGSVISDWRIKSQKKANKSIGFWSCGLRDTFSCEKHGSNATYYGVRGLYSAAALGLAKKKVVGDLGLLFPYLYPNKSDTQKGKHITIHHFHDQRTDQDLLALYGGNSVLRTNVDNTFEAVESFLDELTTAEFILTASLHGAILAYAYGIPFALLNSGKIDCPFKWIDFMSTTGMQTHFVQSNVEGLEWSTKNPIPERYFNLKSLIKSCPFSWNFEFSKQKNSLPVYIR